MRSMRARAFESTPGQLYWRRSEPATTSTRKGRSAVGSLPLSSFGFIGSPPVVVETRESVRRHAECVERLEQRPAGDRPDRRALEPSRARANLHVAHVDGAAPALEPPAEIVVLEDRERPESAEPVVGLA